MLDAPHLERLFLQGNITPTTVRIGHAPRLRILGYLLPGIDVLEIGNTIIKDGTMTSPNNIVLSVELLGLNMCFGIHNEVKMLPSFLRCFPNIETLLVETEEAPEFTTNDVNTKFWQETGPIECVESHLKMMDLRGFQGEQSDLSFLTFIAENARVLEKMVIKLKAGRLPAPAERAVADKLMELLSAKWASGGANLEFWTPWKLYRLKPRSRN